MLHYVALCIHVNALTCHNIIIVIDKASNKALMRKITHYGTQNRTRKTSVTSKIQFLKHLH